MLRLTFRRSVVALLLVGLAWGARGLEAQRRKQLFVSVMESNGTPVAGLEPGDVKVFEDDAVGNTVKVEPIDWPMKLTVLVDNGSRSSDYLSDLRVGLRGLFNEIPDGVEMSLLTLAPQPRWVVRPTTDLEQTIRSVDLISPDGAAGKFWDGLAEAGTRIEKAKGEYFPVIVMVASDVGGREVPLQHEYERLQKQIGERAITVHFVLITTGSQSLGKTTGSLQTNVGIAMTELSGGRYEGINSHSRIATLLPEIGRQIANSHFRQTHQYRVTYEPPPGSSTGPKSVVVRIASRGVALSITPTMNGRLP